MDGKVITPTFELLTPQVRRTLEELDLVPEKVDDRVKAVGTIKALLGNLATVAQRMAELRNPYGTGHGKAARANGLQPRHARLALYSCSRRTKRNTWKRRDN